MRLVRRLVILALALVVLHALGVVEVRKPPAVERVVEQVERVAREWIATLIKRLGDGIALERRS